MIERGKLIDLYIGGMKGDKTGRLIREVKRLRDHSDTRIAVFRPEEDTRSDPHTIQSLDKNRRVIDELPAIEFPGTNPKKIIKIIGGMEAQGEGVHAVAVDELQFCDHEFYSVCDSLLVRGIDLLLAGLELDFKREPFGCTLLLQGLRDQSTKIHWLYPICEKCKSRHRLARFPQRLFRGEPASYDSPQILVEGSSEDTTYEMRCIVCHELPGKPY